MNRWQAVYQEWHLRNGLYDMIDREFRWRQACEGLTVETVAKRLGKPAAQVRGLLAWPGKWTLDTVSDLAFAISGGEVDWRIRLHERIRRTQP